MGEEFMEDRPPKTISIQLPPSLIERMNAEANRRAIGRHLFVKLLLQAALARLEPPETSVRLTERVAVEEET